MKTCLCISGQPRFLETGFSYISKNILDLYHPDVFLHSWYDPIEGRYDYLNNRDSGHQRVGIDQIILELYKPTKWIIEPQKQNISRRPISDYKPNEGAPPFSQFSMFYSIHKAIELKKEYEAEYGEYTCNIRTRFDGGILSPLKIECVYPLDKLYYVDALNWNGKGVVCDWLNFSDSRIMNEVGRVYTLLDDYIDAGQGLCGENMISHHMRKTHIVFDAVPFSFFLIRDRTFEDKSHHGQWH